MEIDLKTNSDVLYQYCWVFNRSSTRYYFTNVSLAAGDSALVTFEDGNMKPAVYKFHVKERKPYLEFNEKVYLIESALCDTFVAEIIMQDTSTGNSVRLYGVIGDPSNSFYDKFFN